MLYLTVAPEVITLGEMRRLPFVAVFFLLVSPIVFGQLIDKPVATVKLSKFEALTVKQFRQQIEGLEARTGNPLSIDDRSKLLDLMISEMLINQAATMDNISVSQGEIDDMTAMLAILGKEMEMISWHGYIFKVIRGSKTDYSSVNIL